MSDAQQYNQQLPFVFLDKARHKCIKVNTTHDALYYFTKIK